MASNEDTIMVDAYGKVTCTECGNDPFKFQHEKNCPVLEESYDEETIIVDDATGGKKGKKPIELHSIPWESLAELGRVFSFGAQKYDDYNFRRGYRWSLSFDALQRHLWAFWSGENRDPESKLHHVAHACWHTLVLLFFSLTGKGTDDRPNTGT